MKNKNMPVYFLELTPWNLGSAFLALMRGQRVGYFSVHRLLRIPFLYRTLLRRFDHLEHRMPDCPGLVFQIDSAALELAEALYDGVRRENPEALALWERVFRSSRVHLYLKKFLAIKTREFVKGYLSSASWVGPGEAPVSFVVPDTPLIRLLLPAFMASYGDARVHIQGLTRRPWARLSRALEGGVATVVMIVWLLWLLGRRGVVLRGRRYRFMVSKEILWSIGNWRKGDDFIVDGRLVRPEDMVFYYRANSAVRGPRPDFLEHSIAAAIAKGYTCVNFDRVPLPLDFVWRVLGGRYLHLAVRLWLSMLSRQIRCVSASVLHRAVMSFLRHAVVWEAFAATYTPRYNLSQDDVSAEHIAATAAMNLYGAQNAGFQYANVTQWRAVSTGYVGYNVYFAWGPFVEKYWRGNWSVDRFVQVGYLWGHHYLQSRERREEIRRAVGGDDRSKRFVVAFLDEKPGPAVQISEDVVYDFYRVGVTLLERRGDTVVILKPKRYDGVGYLPRVKKLVAGQGRSGRLKIWDRGTADATEVIAIADVVVSMIGGAPYLEAICCGKVGLTYDPRGNRHCPFYDRGYRRIIFDDPDELLEAIDGILDGLSRGERAGRLDGLVEELDPYRDFRAMDRMREFIAGVGSTSGLDVVPAGPVPLKGLLGVSA